MGPATPFSECLGSVKDLLTPAESGRHRDNCVGALSLVTDGSQVLVYYIKGKFQRSVMSGLMSGCLSDGLPGESGGSGPPKPP